jgi:cyclase|tara:strand:+ start:108 stop:272 length:165 start_codon:yes stop_codon:yes gene_type:complete
MDAIEWVKQREEFGAGDMFLNSVDQEGPRKGFDVVHVKVVPNAVSVLVVASGWM